jgi:hypothetical protein
MKKFISISLVTIAVGIYGLLHFDNPYKDRIMGYRQRFQLSQDIGASDTVDYTVLASGLQSIVTLHPTRYKPYEFAALFASTLNKLNTTISPDNVDRLIAIATQWLAQDCDPEALQKILNSPVSLLSWLDLPEIVCTHKQLPSLLALIYTTYKKDDSYAQKLYFLAEHTAQ